MRRMGHIYLDNNASTQCDPSVVEKMLPFYNEIYGNPSNNLHSQGQKAKKYVEESREKIANLINAKSKEIYFTSGATESNNLAIQGICKSFQKTNRRRIITSEVEHESVISPLQMLREKDFDVIFLSVDSQCNVSLEEAKRYIDQNTLLVSIQIANNEIGTIQPIAELASISHQAGAFMHCDAAQGVGKINVDVGLIGVDLLSLSAHKFYGPKGIGALFINSEREDLRIQPLVYGGGQEKGLRSGTLNVPGIVGFGEACKLAKENLKNDSDYIEILRDYLEKILLENIPEIIINGKYSKRLPNTSNITFIGIEADALILNCPNLMMSTGSACSSGTIDPSHVLQAMEISRERAFQTIRISLGKHNTQNEVKIATEEIVKAINKIKTVLQNSKNDYEK